MMVIRCLQMRYNSSGCGTISESPHGGESHRCVSFESTVCVHAQTNCRTLVNVGFAFSGREGYTIGIKFKWVRIVPPAFSLSHLGSSE